VAITLAHSASSGAGGSPRTCTITAATLGNMLVAHVCSTTDTGAAPTITNFTQANDGTNAATILAGTTRRHTVLWKVSTGAETAITATQAGVGSIDLQVLEYNSTTGWLANPVDMVAMVTGGTGSVSSLPSAAFTTNYPVAVLSAGASLAAHTVPAFSNGFTVQQDDVNQMFTGDLIVTTAGAYSTVASWTTARVACGGLVAFAANTPPNAAARAGRQAVKTMAYR
jgi:hypothetical protein